MGVTTTEVKEESSNSVGPNIPLSLGTAGY